MIVSLYTSRIVLTTLGITDYGIYNVVGGVVAMFGFITNTMSSASQRFLAYEIGREKQGRLFDTFNVLVLIYIIFAVLILFIGETIGLWFIKNKLNIPLERTRATIWVFHLSILSFIVTILRIPYNATIIAFEEMSFFAWASIVEVILKLAVVFAIVWFNFDKLVLYSLLTLIITIVVTYGYYIFCKHRFNELKFILIWDKKLFRSIFTFAGWNLFDSISLIAMNQGVNILLNIFFGPGINAARSIAYQVSSQSASFVYGFQMATSPQIVKYYASGKIHEMSKLYYKSSKLSFFLLVVVFLPVFYEINFILKFWLNIVPEYTTLFVRLILIMILVDCLSGTTNDVAKASGKIKYYQMVTGLSTFINLPISYLFLKYGKGPEFTIIVAICISFLSLIIRLYILKNILQFSVIKYFKLVILRDVVVLFSSSIIPFFFKNMVEDGVFGFIMSCIICIISSLCSIYILGIDKIERMEISDFFLKKIKKHFHECNRFSFKSSS